MNYDVVVVGGGPAGLMTAKTCAERGLSVVVLEKDNAIGEPKRCAEGLSLHGWKRIGLKHDPRYVAQEIKGAILYAPSGKSVEYSDEDDLGYVVERKVFEKHLAKEAILAGADCMVRTAATGLIEEGGKTAGVRAECLGDEIEFRCRVVVGADGVESKVGRWAGLKTNTPFKDYISGFQYEMAGIENLDMSKLHLWFGNDIAPKGYMWVFPKDEHMANVGIGIIGPANEKRTARHYLEKFIADNPEFFKNASPVEVNAGGVPVSGYMKDPFVKDGLVLVGDSAQMVNPIHGGGMTTNMYAAQIAGRVIAEAIESGDISASKLSEYEKEWKETDGVRMMKLLKLRMFAENLKDQDFEYLADVLSGSDLADMQKGKTKFMLKLLLKKPKLLLYAKRYLSG